MNALFQFLIQPKKTKHETAHNLIKGVLGETVKILGPVVEVFFRTRMINQKKDKI